MLGDSKQIRIENEKPGKLKLQYRNYVSSYFLRGVVLVKITFINNFTEHQEVTGILPRDNH